MALKQKSNLSGVIETAKTILVAILIALSFRSIVAEPFNIPSGSMIPTLLVGDYLFVSKYSFGYSQYSFPFGILPISGRIFVSGMPERGDVAVFRLPSDTSIDYIKRVIGLPGDTIQLKEGRLMINGNQINRRLVGNGNFSHLISAALYQETLPGGKNHIVQELNDQQVFDNTDIFKVPEGHYFMMGDNRDNSRDSRTATVGFVPFENFVGKARFLFFSHNDKAALWQIWKWPVAIRFDRIFKSIN